MQNVSSDAPLPATASADGTDRTEHYGSVNGLSGAVAASLVCAAYVG
jgi:hypothetical protein